MKNSNILEIDAVTVLKPGLFKKEFDLLDKLGAGK